MLHNAAARVGGLDISFVPGEGGRATTEMLRETRTVFFLEADELDMSVRPADAFNIYIGTHGDVGAHHAHVILPSATYTEKAGTYVNTEGRVQLGQRAAFPPGQAKETWAIMRALSDTLGRKLPFDSLAQMREQMYAEHDHLEMIGFVERADPSAIDALAAREGGEAFDAPFTSPVRDFYLTNPDRPRLGRDGGVLRDAAERFGSARSRRVPGGGRVA